MSAASSGGMISKRFDALASDRSSITSACLAGSTSDSDSAAAKVPRTSRSRSLCSGCNCSRMSAMSVGCMSNSCDRVKVSLRSGSSSSSGVT